MEWVGVCVCTGEGGVNECVGGVGGVKECVCVLGSESQRNVICL